MTQTQSDFLLYCRGCTDVQLRNVYAKEILARRQGFAKLARQVMKERGIEP